METCGCIRDDYIVVPLQAAGAVQPGPGCKSFAATNSIGQRWTITVKLSEVWRPQPDESSGTI
jgi:hypothetical protein